MRKKHGPMRADTLRQSMNEAKLAVVLAFIRDYRDLAVQVGRVQWRQFFEAGGTNKYAPAKHLNGICGAAPVQMASYQVQEQIDGWASNRANEFADCVRRSKLPDAAKAQLHAVNRKAAWFCGYVDARNRTSQSEFACRWCGHAKHADANAGCVVAQRRSLGLDAKGPGKAAILDLLTRRHVERWPGTQPKGLPGAARDPRLSNPYFKGWADAARNALATQGLAPRVLQQ